MPSFKCPACGHRHFQEVPKCLNCGTAFVSAPRQQRERAAETPMPEPVNDNDIAEFESFAAEIAQSKAEREEQKEELPDQRDPDSADSEPGEYQPVSPEPSRQLVRRQMDVQQVPRQSWKKQTAIQTYSEPYDMALELAPMAGFGGIAIREEPLKVGDPEYWKADKLPWGFPRIKPDITGAVIHMESKEEVVDYPDLFAAVATLLVELIWVLPNVQENKEGDRIVMTTIRIRTYDGSLRDARLRGNMRGANLSLGDEISLWGAKHHGILLIQRGFNHTTKGVVFTRAIGMFVPALIVIFCIAVAVYFLPNWASLLSHLIASIFGPYFTFFRTHPSILPMHQKK